MVRFNWRALAFAFIVLCVPAFAFAQEAAPPLAPSGDAGGPLDMLLPFLPPAYRQDVPLVIVVASFLAAVLPAPTDTSGTYFTIWRIIHAIALNFGRAAPTPPAVNPAPQGQNKQAGHIRLGALGMITIAAAGLLFLTSCSSSQVQTAEQVACASLPALDAAFKAAILVHSVDPQVLQDEQAAMAGASVACTPPYPTDISSGLSKAAQVAAAVAVAIAKAHASPALAVAS